MNRQLTFACAVWAVVWTAAASVSTQSRPGIGREVAVPVHLDEGREFELPLPALVDHGRHLFAARWTIQEGAGRPTTKGTGAPLSDPWTPLVFPRNFNRVSAPDANSCAGCHNAPHGLVGGGGDIVANVSVLGQRFDFATLDPYDVVPTRGAVDERGLPTTLQTMANSRITVGMFGSGYVEMLARQMTVDLQATRNAMPPGTARSLVTTGVGFGRLVRRADGSWDTSGVEGLAAASLASAGPTAPPSLVVRPFHQAGNVVSLRQFTNNAYNHHHGIQSTERFGVDTDPDGDGVVSELTTGDVTAAVVFQATMAVPGRVVPRDPEIEVAIATGEQRFVHLGCATCHRPSLPLRKGGWVFTEPNPFNPPGNLRLGEAPTLAVDLSDPRLPQPRLPVQHGVVQVPAFTDLKLHDITDGPDDPNAEPLDMNQPAGSPGFFAGNRRFLTRKLWGTGADGTYFHHGQYTTMREAILAHGGEAAETRAAFLADAPADQNSLIEFLKSLQVLPPGTRSLVVDESGRPRSWPPRRER
jgi:Di-haem oxidoreductase, putative peroxidase